MRINIALDNLTVIKFLRRHFFSLYKSSNFFRAIPLAYSWLTLDLRIRLQGKKIIYCRLTLVDLFRELNKFTITPPKRFSDISDCGKKSRRTISAAKNCISRHVFNAHISFANSRFFEVVKRINFVCIYQIRYSSRISRFNILMQNN